MEKLFTRIHPGSHFTQNYLRMIEQDNGRSDNRLLGKVMEEIRNPQQFFDPQRRNVLLRNGLISVNTAIKERYFEEDLDPHKILEKLKKPMHSLSKSGDKGEDFIVSRKVPVAAIVFPSKAEIDFKFNKDEADYYISGPTYNGHGLHQGMKTKGNVQKFPERSKESQIQHGGVLINNATHEILLLRYSDLVTAQNLKRYTEKDILIEGNWYIDSQNYLDVLSLPNLQSKRRPYNSIGMMWDESNNPQFFTLNNYFGSANWIKSTVTGTKSEIDINANLSEMVAMAMLISEKYNKPNWRMVGLEYNSGGTYRKYQQRMINTGSFQVKL